MKFNIYKRKKFLSVFAIEERTFYILPNIELKINPYNNKLIILIINLFTLNLYFRFGILKKKWKYVDEFIFTINNYEYLMYDKYSFNILPTIKIYFSKDPFIIISIRFTTFCLKFLIKI